MDNIESVKASSIPLLTICVPTFNRADCLDNCLESLHRATRRCVDNIQIVVSDNASTDHTQQVVEKWSISLPMLYIRNPVNIGGERNFFASAAHAKAEYVWIFGDDDDFGKSAVEDVLRLVEQRYDLIVANYSSWSKNMKELITARVLSPAYRPEYHDPDTILSEFGILMGFISSVIVRKDILLSVPPSEYEVFVPYGFPFPYSVYSGLPRPTRMAFLSVPLFRRREHNSDLLVRCHETWIKFFIEGPALVFEALGRKGYSKAAVARAKTITLRDFNVGNILPGIDRVDRCAARTMMYRHYRSSWRYWLLWLPFLVLPVGWIQAAVRFRNRLRNRQD